MSNENQTVEEFLSKRYSTECPHCEKTIHPTRSLGMLAFRMTEGYGDCPFCKRKVQLQYNPEADTLTAHRDPVSDEINATRAARKGEEQE